MSVSLVNDVGSTIDNRWRTPQKLPSAGRDSNTKRDRQSVNWFGGDLDRFRAVFPLNKNDPRNQRKPTNKTLWVRVISRIALPGAVIFAPKRRTLGDLNCAGPSRGDRASLNIRCCARPVARRPDRGSS